ncbi:MAG: YitT family protein [Desulfarculus sp.]|nr:YitT family protein [Pseudomonadota bacterium]MBV1717057.1 YitT family protein [Desulfarculus sp.]MBU4574948.1 YitT family protein [Pseudomonadota bacterium]MBU4596345.1 YitT family protein [Pseudomonadota bacterium]MBV1737704.1 YitT family protein [Desulfarculus sp.]
METLDTIETPEQNGAPPPEPPPRPSRLGPVGRVVLNLVLMIAGNLCAAVAVNGILVPQGLLSGGFTGLSILLYYLPPHLPVGLWYLILNIPIFALGWRMVGRRFFYWSLVGMGMLTMALEVVKVPVILEDPLAGALLAGILFGAGGGLVLKSQGSAGGLDILSVILMQRFSVRLGTTLLGFNVVVLGLGALLFPLTKIMYTLAMIFVAAQVTNLVFSGLSQRKAVTIISHRWQDIAKAIVSDSRAGATLIPAKGAFSGMDEPMVYTVVNLRELGRIKALVNSLDPDAFMVVSDTLEVSGQRIGRATHW